MYVENETGIIKKNSYQFNKILIGIKIAKEKEKKR